MFLIGFWLRSLRWWWMVPRESAPTRREAFDAFMIGALGNNLMPGRLGDLLRGAVLGRHLSTIGTSGALASIVLEKVLDGLVVLAMLGIALVLAPLPEWLVHAGFLGLLIFVGMLGGLLVLNAAGSSERLLRWADAVKVLAILAILASRLSRGLHGLRSCRRFVELMGFSILIWGVETGVLFLTFCMFELDLPVEAAIVTVVLLAIGTMLPAAPGFVGTYQYFVLTALSFYDVPQTIAMALALSLNILVILVTTATGIVAVFLEGGLGEAFKKQRGLA
jgi:hypothetical protein